MRFIRSLSMVFCLVLAAVLLWRWQMPAFVEGLVLSNLAKQFPGLESQIEVRRVGFDGADLSRLTVGSLERPVLAVDSLKLDYSLFGIFAKQIDRVQVDGLRIEATYRDGRFSLPGIAMPQAKPGTKEEKFTLPMLIGALSVNSGLFVCETEKGRMQVPFSFQALQENPSGLGDASAPYRMKLQLYPLGQEVQLSARLRLEDNLGSVQLQVPNFALASLASFKKVPFSGNCTLQGEGRFQLQPFSLQQSKLTLAFDELFYGPTAKEVLGKPASFTVDGVDGTWRLAGDALALKTPLRIELSDLQGEFVKKEKVLQATLRLSSLSRLPGLSPFATQWQVSWQREEEKPWQLTVAGEALSLAKQKPGLGFKGLHLTASSEAGSILHWLFEMKDAWFSSKELHAQVPFMGVTGKMVPEGDISQITSRMIVEGGSLRGVAETWRAGKISVDLPISWPSPTDVQAGRLRVGELAWGQRNFAKLTATAIQKGPSLELSGQVVSQLLSGYTLPFNGKAEYFVGQKEFSADFSFAAKPQNIFLADWGELAPAAQGVAAAGELAISGRLEKTPQKQSAGIDIKLAQGQVDILEKDLSIEGINLSFAMPKLLDKRSAPAQSLTFAKASVAGLSFSDGKVIFQLEESDSLLLEEASFSWCDGHVYTHAVRFSPKRKEYAVSLFCDRLKLAKILEQFGVERASGEGAVSGRVPLIFSKGRLSFADGFLFSSPGEGGSIRVAEMDLLTQSIPQGTPQFAQLDFASEALKDFSYKWAKLLLKNEGDNLLLQMQLDGEPAQPIPFRYDKKLGAFTRLGVEGKGGIKHPIRLDVNFRLPFDKIMHYGTGMQQLYQLTQ